MSRVITFSTVFPSYHPKAGEPTGFVEKIQGKKKHHTIRAGNRWEVGDWFSPRAWSGKPYRSKQIVIGPDFEIKKIWDIDIVGTDFTLLGRHTDRKLKEGFYLPDLAANDGLNGIDFFDWFTLSPEYDKTQEFHGQVICWNSQIEY